MSPWLLRTLILIPLLVAAGACVSRPAENSGAGGGAGQTGQGSPGREPSMGGGAEAKGAIRFALLSPTTGTVASSGEDMRRGWNLFWEQHGLNVCGGARRVELFHEDTAGNPDTALAKARLLVEQRNVHALFGPMLANEAYAVAGYFKEVPIFLQVGSADDLTQRKRQPNVLRPAGWASSQTHHPFGEWVYDQGVRQILTVGADYAFGHEVTGGFLRTFTLRGGKVIGQLWNPLGTPDFSSYMAQIQNARPQAVFVIQLGADGVRFMKAWVNFGLKGKIALYGGEVLLDQSLLRSMGDEALGVLSAGHFTEGRDDPATQNFVREFDQKYKLLPSYYAAASYTVGQWVVQALEGIQCNVEDRPAFLDAVKKVRLENSPMGPMSLDDYGNPIMNIYIRKAERRADGRLWNTVIKTIPNVSQFWNFKPEEFLKDPVYSRDYQGIKK